MGKIKFSHHEIDKLSNIGIYLLILFGDFGMKTIM